LPVSLTTTSALLINGQSGFEDALLLNQVSPEINPLLIFILRTGSNFD
jgi:hypothetical protein